MILKICRSSTLVNLCRITLHLVSRCHFASKLGSVHILLSPCGNLWGLLFGIRIRVWLSLGSYCIQCRRIDCQASGHSAMKTSGNHSILQTLSFMNLNFVALFLCDEKLHLFLIMVSCLLLKYSQRWALNSVSKLASFFISIFR